MSHSPKIENGSVCVKLRPSGQVNGIEISTAMKKAGVREGEHYIKENGMYLIPKDNLVLRDKALRAANYLGTNNQISTDLDVIPTVLVSQRQIDMARAAQEAGAFKG